MLGVRRDVRWWGPDIKPNLNRKDMKKKKLSSLPILFLRVPGIHLLQTTPRNLV